MKKLTLILLFLLGSSIIYAQGIQFEKGLNWQQLKEKAKSENKFIFVDCYATWCGPCKMMDLTVYPNEKVGAAMKDKFLAVKIQFDETANDNAEVKQWHEIARALNQEYKIAGYPAYLFFSAQGKLVYQTLGFKDPDAFVTMVNYAMTDPLEKFNGQLADYKQGKRNYPEMPKLITLVSEAGDKEQADLMMKDYKNNYLDKLSDTEMLTRENLFFILEHPNLVSSKDKFFNLFYHHGNKIDTIIADKGVSNRMVQYTIIKEEIEDKLWKDDKPVSLDPNWQKLESTINKKYEKVDAKTMVAEARLNFYKKNENWKEYARLMDQQIKNNPPKSGGGLEGSSWKLNSIAWNTFLHCLDKTVLERALAWSELSIKLDDADKPNVQLLDTRANLLYKLGRVNEAITQEEKAIEIDNANTKKAGREGAGYFAKEYAKLIEKMKAGIPTWRVAGGADGKP